MGAGALGAHPRSRGENEEKQSVLPGGDGSSPLTRGKLRARERGVNRLGLIPAHAGKTKAAQDGICQGWAHPRSRGENARTTHREHDGGGSSPLTRGKRLYGAEALAVRGLIPAHAGKTARDGSTRQALRAHPRSRGEN